MSLRAAIRANVLLARLSPSSRDKTRMIMRSGSRHILNLRAALIHPATPTLVAIGGLSGTGKSVLARALAPDRHAVAGSGRVAQRRSAEAAISNQ